MGGYCNHCDWCGELFWCDDAEQAKCPTCVELPDEERNRTRSAEMEWEYIQGLRGAGK